MTSWRQVPTLPFEWLSLSKRWRSEFQLPVARHMSPIVMAVGLAKSQNDPSRNPITRLVRRMLRMKTIAQLERYQAANDSFLASPLMTAFVVMNLAGSGCREHDIVKRGLEFLLSSVRGDASWSVTSNLATINTTVALDSLTAESEASSARRCSQWSSDQGRSHWQDTDVEATHSHVTTDSDHSVSHDLRAGPGCDFNESSIDWLLQNQHAAPSQLTDVPAGGWSASDVPGAEPTTIATAGVLRGLVQASGGRGVVRDKRIDRAVDLGIGWLLEMQNEDGGWATYCHGDDTQNRDRSGVDPTAQTLRAIAVWQRLWKMESQRRPHTARSLLLPRVGPAIDHAMSYLESQQRDDGSFVPLWFGNEHQSDDENPVIGTAQVLTACAELHCLDSNTAQRAAGWLLASQHSSGGWGPPRAPVDYSGSERERNVRSWRENETQAKFCSVEETAAAVSALIPLAATTPAFEGPVSRGLIWLIDAVEQDRHRQPAIIGFYLSRIWYYERLYPLAFAGWRVVAGYGCTCARGVDDIS